MKTAPTKQAQPASLCSNRALEANQYNFLAGPTDAQSLSDVSYANAVIPLDNRGQINLSKEGPIREFSNALSLRPTSNLSPLRAGGPPYNLGQSSSGN